MLDPTNRRYNKCPIPDEQRKCPICNCNLWCFKTCNGVSHGCQNCNSEWSARLSMADGSCSSALGRAGIDGGNWVMERFGKSGNESSIEIMEQETK